ncbi:hypothetical protein CL616_05090 [archaeon]|nr:hypothetical protein [archaeon]|tara:strand:+ start:1409 stop:2602 length:1194 start_codon:yes stop_codon:yes gene_type:complete
MLFRKKNMDFGKFRANYDELREEDKDQLIEELLEFYERDQPGSVPVMELKGITKVARHFVNDPEFDVDWVFAKKTYEWCVYGFERINDGLSTGEFEQGNLGKNFELVASHFLTHASSLAFIISGADVEHRVEGKLTKEEQIEWGEKSLEARLKEMDVRYEFSNPRGTEYVEACKAGIDYGRELRDMYGDVEKWENVRLSLAIKGVKIAQKREHRPQYYDLLKIAIINSGIAYNLTNKAKWKLISLDLQVNEANSLLEDKEIEGAKSKYSRIEKGYKRFTASPKKKRFRKIKDMWVNASETAEDPSDKVYFLERAALNRGDYFLANQRKPKILREAINLQIEAADIAIDNGLREITSRVVVDLINNCTRIRELRRIDANARKRYDKIIRKYESHVQPF